MHRTMAHVSIAADHSSNLSTARSPVRCTRATARPSARSANALRAAIPSEESRMFDALIELLPAEWRAAATALTAPLRWIPEWQAILLGSITSGSSAIGVAVASIALLAPAMLLVAGTWCTMLSLYTLPFRSGRG